MFNYNIHPILVHFPVALLFLYSVIKILPFQKWFPSASWKHIERAILFFGVLAAFATDATGDVARHLLQPNRQVVNAHENFAAISIWLYSLILAGEIVAVVKSQYPQFLKNETLKKVADSIEKVLYNRSLSGVLAFLGLIAITTTGLLGGVMVYGTSADPLAGIVLKLLGITL